MDGDVAADRERPTTEKTLTQALNPVDLNPVRQLRDRHASIQYPHVRHVACPCRDRGVYQTDTSGGGSCPGSNPGLKRGDCDQLQAATTGGTPVLLRVACTEQAGDRRGFPSADK